MKRLRRAAVRFCGVFRIREIEKEIDEELASHLQLHIDDNLRLGMTEDEARRDALRCLGDPVATKIQYREEALIPLLFRRIQDFLYSLSTLKKSALFTASLIFALSVGIGAATAIFSILHNVLISPYPYAQSHDMYHLIVSGPENDLVWPLYTEEQLHEIQASSVVDSAMGYRNREFKYEMNRNEAVATGTELTGNAFSYLGVPVLYGRGLGQADITSQGEARPVVVLSYALWKSVFHKNHQILGTVLKLDRRPFTVVGVAAPHFTWGDGALFVPVGLRDDSSERYEINLRLKAGVSAGYANEVLGALLHDFAKQNPSQFPHDFRLELAHLNVPFSRHSRSILQVLTFAAIALCFIVFANVCLLAASRIASRNFEFELAPEAQPEARRLLSYLLTESALISLVGCAGGLLLALPLTPLLQASFPAWTFPSEAPTHLGLAGCGICGLFGIACFVLLGTVAGRACLYPSARLATQILPLQVLHPLQSVIIVGQVALTVMLLVASYLAMATYLHVVHQPLGYKPAGVLVGNLPVNEVKYPAWQQRAVYFEYILTSLENASKGSKIALISYATPPTGGFKTVVTLLGQGSPSQHLVLSHFVSPDYFSLLQVPLLAGSLWTTEEETEGVPVVVINDAMRRQLFGDEQVLGRWIRLPPSSYMQYSLSAPLSGTWMRIVGVVADFRGDNLEKSIVPAIYLPFTMLLDRETQILIRPANEDKNTIAKLRNQLHSVDTSLPENVPLRDLDSVLQNSPGRTRARLLALASIGFGAGALLVGIFSLYSNWRLNMSAAATTAQASSAFSHFPKVLWGILVGLIGIDILRSTFQSDLLAGSLPIIRIVETISGILFLAILIYKTIRFGMLRHQ